MIPSYFLFELIMFRVYQNIVRTMLVQQVNPNVITVTNRQSEWRG